MFFPKPLFDWNNPTQQRTCRLYKAIARFAARAKSGPGFPPAWAELADPNVGETGKGVKRGMPNQPASDW